MSVMVAPSAHAEFQYPSAEHQSKTAISGMWLFLATELLFFGALFYLWMMLRRWHLDGFGKAAPDTDLLIGMGLVSWIAWRAHRGRFSPGYYTPVEAVGLYWSFVDLVWLNLYPFIYLVDRR
jgi:heme/copper-type cytochrome/quinol oxidase subunit 3